MHQYANVLQLSSPLSSQVSHAAYRSFSRDQKGQRVKVMSSNPNQNQHSAVTCPPPKQTDQKPPAGIFLDRSSLHSRTSKRKSHLKQQTVQIEEPNTARTSEMHVQIPKSSFEQVQMFRQEFSFVQTRETNSGASSPSSKQKVVVLSNTGEKQDEHETDSNRPAFFNVEPLKMNRVSVHPTANHSPLVGSTEKKQSPETAGKTDKPEARMLPEFQSVRATPDETLPSFGPPSINLKLTLQKTKQDKPRKEKANYENRTYQSSTKPEIEVGADDLTPLTLNSYPNSGRMRFKSSNNIQDQQVTTLDGTWRKTETLRISNNDLQIFTENTLNDAVSYFKTGKPQIDVQIKGLKEPDTQSKKENKQDIKEWINSMKQRQSLTDKQRTLLEHRESRNQKKRKSRTVRDRPKNGFLLAYKARQSLADKRNSQNDQSMSKNNITRSNSVQDITREECASFLQKFYMERKTLQSTRQSAVESLTLYNGNVEFIPVSTIIEFARSKRAHSMNQVVTRGSSTRHEYERIRRTDQQEQGIEQLLGLKLDDNQTPPNLVRIKVFKELTDKDPKQADSQDSMALVPFETKEVKVVDRMREKYFRRVEEVMQEHKNLEFKVRKERPFSSANHFAIKSYQNKTSLELGTYQSPNSGFFITNPEHDTSCIKESTLALPAPPLKQKLQESLTNQSNYSREMKLFSEQSHRMRNKAYSFNKTISVNDIKQTVELNVLKLRHRLVAPQPATKPEPVRHHRRTQSANVNCYRTQIITNRRESFISTPVNADIQTKPANSFYAAQAQKYSQMLKTHDPSQNLPTAFHSLNSRVVQSGRSQQMQSKLILHQARIDRLMLYSQQGPRAKLNQIQTIN